MSQEAPLTILVAGLGALGTVFAALLKKAGHTVYALTKEQYLAGLSQGKLSVTGIWGDHQATIDGISGTIAPFRDRNFDVIIVTVKSYDTRTVVEQVKPLVSTNTLVVSAQNGYGNYETIAETAGREHALLARVIFGAKVSMPGKAEVTVIADDVRVGQPEGAVDAARIAKIAAAFTEAGIPTKYAGNIEAILWDKILYNAALNPLGALLECTYGGLAGNEETRDLMDAIIEEIFSVARAHQKPLNWKSAEEYKNHFYTKLVPPTAKHFPSMYYDVKAGKRLEIDALNGAIVRLAKEKGIAVPGNETITKLIKARESFGRNPKT